MFYIHMNMLIKLSGIFELKPFFGKKKKQLIFMLTKDTLKY